MKDYKEIEKIRHSTSHLMSMAIMELYPKAGLGVGPFIENGFYQDYDLPEPISEEILPKLEKRIKEMIAQEIKFEQHAMDFDEALKLYKHDPYKTELIEDLKKAGEKNVSFYKSDWFENLCKGPHVKSTKEINPEAFKLTSIAGSYWRGNEKNKMLTRIYGVSFETKKELDDYLTMQEEAKKRDHRKLGKDLEIFTFSEEIGGGLPVWLPNGTIIRDELEKLAKETEFIGGYDRVSTPVITKEDLFIKSGHLPHYKDSMYAPMDIDGENYYLKPMNCPFHHVAYQSKPRSYRDLPVRLTEYGLCHRYEKSGELQGLMRVRSMLMNDAHIYVRPDQVKDEIKKVLELHQYYYNLLGINKIQYRLSKHDAADLGGKYVDLPKEWQENEQILREVLQESGLDFFEAENEASFYGPKIDVQIFSAIGKEYTIGTVQLDFAQPKKFELTYIDETGKEQMPYCIHRAPLSTHERFIAFLLEHFGGNFPLWLAPTQVKILAVAESHKDYCDKLAGLFRQELIRATVDSSNETIGNKVRKASGEKIPYMLVVGDKEMGGEMLSVRIRGQKEMLQISQEQFLKQLLIDIKERKLAP